MVNVLHKVQTPGTDSSGQLTGSSSRDFSEFSMGADDDLDGSAPPAALVSWSTSMANLNNLGGGGSNGGVAGMDRSRRGAGETSGGGEASGRVGGQAPAEVTITVASGQALKQIKTYGQLMRSVPCTTDGRGH